MRCRPESPDHERYRAWLEQVRRDDAHDLRDVRGQQLLAKCIRPVDEVGARRNGFDHAAPADAGDLDDAEPHGGVLGGPVFKTVTSFALAQMRIPPSGTESPQIPTTW